MWQKKVKSKNHNLRQTRSAQTRDKDVNDGSPGKSDYPNRHINSFNIALMEAKEKERKQNTPQRRCAMFFAYEDRQNRQGILLQVHPRLISIIPAAVAEAAIKSGVARKKIKDFDLYKDELTNRLDPSMSLMQGINAKVRKNPKRVVFAEGEDKNMLKAAIEFGKNKLGTPILIGAEKRIREQLKKIGLDENYKIQIVNSTDKEKREKYVKYLYKKLQRDGQLERDVDRLVRNERIAWGSSMIACGDADAMVTGNIRHYAASIEKLKKVVESRPGEPIFGMTMMVSKGKTILVADTNVQDFPSAKRLVDVSISCVRVSRLFGFDPKVAFLSHSTFGKPVSKNKHVRCD